MFIDEDACRVVGERVFCEVIISGVVHETMIGTDAQVSHLYLIEDGRILSIEETTVVVGDPDDAYAVRHFARAESPEEADTMTAAIYGPGSAESGRLWLKWAVLWDEAGRPPRSGG